MKFRVFALLISIGFSSRAFSQNHGFFYRSLPSQITLHDESGLIHADSPEYERVNPITLFIINPKLRTHAAKDGSFSLSYNSSNVWNPTVYVMPRSDSSEGPSEIIFVNPDNSTPVDDLNQQSEIKFSNMSASDFEKHAKVFHADGVLRNIDLKYTRPLKGNSEISAQLAIYQLVGGNEMIDPSDRFIESFHQKILHVDQPYGRNKIPYNQAEIYFRDANGHEVRFNEGDINSAIRLDYVKSFDIISRDKKVLTTINLIGSTGTTLSYKARKLNPAIQLGAGLNQATTAKITPRFTTTLATGYNVVLPEAIPLGAGVDLGLNQYRGQISLLAAFSHTNRKHTRVTTYGVAYQKNSILIQSDNQVKAPILENDPYYPKRPKGSHQSENLFNVPNEQLQGFVAIEFKRPKIIGKIWSGEDMVPTTNGEDLNFGASLIKKF